MVKITQTKVDENKVKEINEKLLSINNKIKESQIELKNLILEREKLHVLYFCGKEILYEEEFVYKNDYKNAYTLAIIMNTGRSDFKVHARVHRDMSNLTKEIYHAEVDEHGVNRHYPSWWYNSDVRKSKYGLTYDEAKELSRTWLAELIEKYGDKE